MMKIEIGERIREARKRKKLTQEELAEKIEVCPTYLSDIERGKKTPSLGMFITIADALDVSADALLRGELEAGKHHIYDALTRKLEALTPKQRQCVSDIIDAYLKSL